jgi:phosphoribosylformimino-5-aminoimidazole carboxamide ribonucleotide (ProFAR) isomerase
VPAFDVIPALDLRAGRLARVTGGDPSTLREVAGDPLALARRYAAAGATWIHVADLDAAIDGEPANLDLLPALAALGVRVQAGGSLSSDGVQAALAHGAARAVLGAQALGDEEVLLRAVARHGDRLGVALDVRGDRVAPRGRSAPGPAVSEALARLARARPAFVVHTESGRDGALLGPDLDGLDRVARAVGVPVLASGGVRSLDDVAALAALAPAVAGVVVGRAFQDGVISVRDALDVAGRR